MRLTRSSGCDGTVGLLLQHLIKRVPGEFLSRSGEDSTKSARMHLDVDDTQGASVNPKLDLPSFIVSVDTIIVSILYYIFL